MREVRRLGALPDYLHHLVDEQPPSGEFITALVGGRAEQLGFDGEHVAGVGVSDVVVTRDAIVHVFSQSVGEPVHVACARRRPNCARRSCSRT